MSHFFENGSKRRILTTKWVADAWEKIKKEPDKIKYSFLKYGLSNNLSGTEDDKMKISGIEEYTMPPAEREFTLLEDDKESGSDSEFMEVDNACSNDLTKSDS